MIKLPKKLNIILSIISLSFVVFGSAAAYNNNYMLPQTNEISAVSAQGSFGNINLMTKAEFAELPGIGNTLAERIVEYRNKNGSFSSAEEIMEVRGIGKGKFEKLKDIIYTSR
ncbi:MAG: helix-hairpin-helix domain-containing protein [Clostridia bacterium]|nr:helix-hairpin-helix domain-containing protein [Clostridia bacterium]